MKLALLGDIALFGVFSKASNLNLEQTLKDVSDYLSTFDYVVGNLETPFSSARKTFGAKSAYICANPDDVTILKLLHIDAVTLANNHMFDYGKEGYELTKQLLNKSEIEWFGCEGKELRIIKDGNRLSFAGFCCYTSNPLSCVQYGNYGVNAYNLLKAKEFIKKSLAEECLPILAVHAGLEHVNYPSLEHVRAARLLADSGNYVYYGHHPHVIQGLEEYNGSLIAHSLGNFCFDDVWTDASSEKPLVELTDNNRTGIILELTIENNNLMSWKEQVIYIEKNAIIRLINKEDSIKEYNDILHNCELDTDNYTAMRQSILNNRMEERKAKRNYIWYLKRLRPRYVKILLNARRNSKFFNENVLKFIKS